MLYPSRSVRRRKTSSSLHCQTKRRRKTNIQSIPSTHVDSVETTKNVKPKRVSFSGKLSVCTFDKTTPPIVSLIRRPSRIDNYGVNSLIAEGERIGLICRGKSIEELKKEIIPYWLADLRTHLKDMEISDKSIPDSELESLYNLCLAIKRSVNLKMTGEEVVPQLMSLEQLQEFMRNHQLTVLPSTSREECIQIVETYLMEHTEPSKGEKYDMYRRRLSAADIFRRDYRFHSSAMLKSVLDKHKIMPPRTMAQRRQAVIRLLDRNLKKEFLGRMKDFLEDVIRWYGEEPKGRTESDHLHQLLRIKRERKEIILEETE